MQLNDLDENSGAKIGLTNSKILAEACGGSISVRSEFGKFTAVTFTVNAPDISQNVEVAE